MDGTRSEKTVAYKGLSRMLDILYSKFWAATAMTSTESKKGEINTKGTGDEPRGLMSFSQYLPLRATISPQAPPTLELISNAFQR